MCITVLEHAVKIFAAIFSLFFFILHIDKHTILHLIRNLYCKIFFSPKHTTKILKRLTLHQKRGVFKLFMVSVDTPRSLVSGSARAKTQTDRLLHFNRLRAGSNLYFSRCKVNVQTHRQPVQNLMHTYIYCFMVHVASQ